MTKVCNVRILSTTEGKSTPIQTVGNLSDGEKNTLLYQQEGDEVTLVFDEKTLLMSRHGKAELQMQFMPHAHTQMTIGEGGAKGSVPLFTSRYELVKRKSVWTLTLDYAIAYTTEKQKFLLKIEVSFGG